MDNTELSKRLRALSTKGSSYRRTICKMAAQRIDKLASELQAIATLAHDAQCRLDAALADLQNADANCAFCAHKSPPAPCAEDDEHYDCVSCPHDCYCKDCVDNSKWEYQKIKEAKQ